MGRVDSLHRRASMEHRTSLLLTPRRPQRAEHYPHKVSLTSLDLQTVQKLGSWIKWLLVHTDLRPVWHLPLRAAGFNPAGFAHYGSVQLCSVAQIIVHRAVEAWRHHLPAAHRPKLKALATCPRALAPAARLPPATYTKSLLGLPLILWITYSLA